VDEFAAVFSLVWIAWLNGTLYYDLHGHEDGRTRSFVFGQMLLLALLAVFTEHATDSSGAQFALTYAAFMLLMSVQWCDVRRQDAEEYSSLTARYLTGMLLT
jgi:low temperature requirement protein LtrA